MSYKSRGNWNINKCLKECENKNKFCKVCIRFNYYKLLEITEESKRKAIENNAYCSSK
jgi:hypothetical protein